MRIELKAGEHDGFSDVHQFLREHAQGLEDQDALPDHVRDLRAAARTIHNALARERDR